MRKRRRASRYIGEDERWIVVFGLRFGLKVGGKKIKFADGALNKSNTESANQILFYL